MYKVLLVDDEALIREAISENIPWEEMGFELIASCENGREAMERMKEVTPDLLLTDIYMPYVDGIELARYVNENHPDTKTVIISGYDEFDYAKEAIKIGISDYLLKPVTSVTLIDALKKAAETIREEQEHSRLLERYFVNYEKYMEFPDKTDYSGVDRKLIKNFLKTGEIEECAIFIDEYFEAVGKENYMSLLLRQYMTMDIFYCVREFVKAVGVEEAEDSGEWMDLKRLTKAIESAENTIHYLKELFTFALTVRDNNSGDKYGQIIREAKEYIGEHFGNSEFSLNRIAEYIGMSPSYFSSIFKQGTGQTLVEYLTRVRIDKACELLKCTNLRAAEIGEQVGYGDPHYFSATFKKIMGQSPTDFRGGKNMEN